MTISRWLIIAFVIGLALTIMADLWLKAGGDSKAHLWGGGLVGYWAVFGLVWYLLIVGLSKLLGRYWLERPEDYYDGEDQVNNG